MSGCAGKVRPSGSRKRSILAPGTGAGNTIVRAAVIALISSGTGLVYNALSPSGIPLSGPDRPSLHRVASLRLSVTAQEAKQAFDQQSYTGAVFIDARAARDYIAGHIIGALNVHAAQSMESIRLLLKSLPRDAPIIVYCSGSRCQSSVFLAQILIERMGFTRVQVFHAGWQGWVASGYPIASGSSP